MFGVHPLLVALFMCAGGALTALFLFLVTFAQERIAYNRSPRRGRHRTIKS